jgi:hypothetical protein
MAACRDAQKAQRLRRSHMTLLMRFFTRLFWTLELLSFGEAVRRRFVDDTPKGALRAGGALDVYICVCIAGEVALYCTAGSVPHGVVALLVVYRLVEIIQVYGNMLIFTQLRDPGRSSVLSVSRTLVQMLLLLGEAILLYGLLFYLLRRHTSNVSDPATALYLSIGTMSTGPSVESTDWVRFLAASEVLFGFLFAVTILGRAVGLLPRFVDLANPEASAEPRAALTSGGCAPPPLPESSAVDGAHSAATSSRLTRLIRRLLIVEVLTVGLVLATFAAVVVVLHDQHNANQTAKEIQHEADKSARRIQSLANETADSKQLTAIRLAAKLQMQALSAQREAAVLTGDYTAEVYVTRVRQAVIGLQALLRVRRELQPSILLANLDVSVGDGVAILDTAARPGALAALSNFLGQLRVTYGNFHPPRERHALTHRDQIRVCRTLKFAAQLETTFAGVPHVGLSRKFKLVLPQQCR